MTNASTDASTGKSASRPPLRLQAVDVEDVEVLSAALQDAIFRVADMAFVPEKKRFALVGCRFDWLSAASGAPERARIGVHFDHVSKVTRSGFDQKAGDTVLNLLGIVFTLGPVASEAPAGVVELVFSAGAAVRLDVECIEAQMSDLGQRWPARAVPGHALDDPALDQATG